MPRRTRIIATLGPATATPAVLEQLLRAGVDVMRINFSHGTAVEHRRNIGQVRALGAALDRPIGVLADLPGPKMRALLTAPVEFVAGQQIALSAVPGPDTIGVTEPEVLGTLRAGERVLCDDGREQLVVERVHSGGAVLRVVVGGTLLPNKGINLPDTALALPAVTERDRAALAVLAETGADWLALSFVRSAEAATALRQAAREVGLDLPVLAKIERPEAGRDAEAIVAAFDGIMVARGDLGVEIPLEQVPHVQKRLITLARRAGKPAITATEMLDSMRGNPRPTRAEVSDVANAVYDGTDAVMLSGETAVGQYPLETVATMERILREAEQHQLEDGPRPVEVPRADRHDHMTHLTCGLAREVGAQAIIAPTVTGRTARLVARHRPRTRIIAPSANPEVLRRLALVWGLEPVPLPESRPGQDRLEAAVQAAFQHGAVSAGDVAVVLAGHPLEGGGLLPTIRLVRVGADGRSHEP